jgi:hypothetical protein
MGVRRERAPAVAAARKRECIIIGWEVLRGFGLNRRTGENQPDFTIR